MKIGIDGRLWNETGVGRYIRALVSNLSEVDKKNEYVLFLGKQAFEAVELPSNNWQKILTNVAWHSIAEQIVMPSFYEKFQLDLVHIPYFSVPILTKIPFVVTIHDLTISQYATGKATTKPWFIYKAKRFGYSFVLDQCIKKAQAIVTVSETVKKQILSDYHLSTDKVFVTPESGELEAKENVNVKTPHKYILYIGNAHPHKNLENLVLAFKKLVQIYKNYKLVFIGPDDYFYKKLKEYCIKQEIDEKIFIVNNVDNNALKSWYEQAEVLVFPSLSEGFGIPGLEAMLLGTPVAASDIAVFHEIYGDNVLYFNQDDPDSIMRTINTLISNPTLRTKLTTLSRKKAKEYSWKRMAQETLAIYEHCYRLRSR